MDEILDDLCRNLDEEIRERTGLLELVEHKAHTIRTGDAGDLDSVLSGVRRRLAALAQTEGRRRAILDRCSDLLGPGTAGLALGEIAERVGEPWEGRLLERRDTLREILRETLQRNRRNLHLLRFATQVVDDTLDLLTSDRRTERIIYGPQGRLGRPGRQGTLFQAKV